MVRIEQVECVGSLGGPRGRVRQPKWSTSPTMLGMHCTFNRRSVGVEMGGFASCGFDAPQLATSAHVFAFLCYHLQIPVRQARAGVGPGIASHKDLGPAGGGHHDPSDDPSFMQRLFAWSAMSIVRAMPTRCGIYTGPRRRVCRRLIQARPCRPSPHRRRSFRTFTRSADFNRPSRCSRIALP